MSRILCTRAAVPAAPVAARRLASTRSNFAANVPSIRTRHVSHLSTRRKQHTLTRAGWNDFEWGTCEIVSNVSAAKEGGLHTVMVSVAEDTTKAYTTAGQFVQMRVGEDGKPAFLAIASPPGADAKVVQLLIKSVDGTAGDICAMKPGDKLDVSPAMGGGFDLGKAPANETPTTLLFATGSGISPIRSLIMSGTLSDRDVTLFYGTANEKTTAFLDEFKEWENKGVKVVHVQSQVGGPPTYVQDALKEELENFDSKKTCAVLCGQKEMTEAVIETLVGHGIAKEMCIMNF